MLDWLLTIQWLLYRNSRDLELRTDIYIVSKVMAMSLVLHEQHYEYIKKFDLKKNRTSEMVDFLKSMAITNDKWMKMSQTASEMNNQMIHG